MNSVIIIFKTNEKVIFNNVYSISANEESMVIAHSEKDGNKFEYPSLSSISVIYVS